MKQQITSTNRKYMILHGLLVGTIATLLSTILTLGHTNVALTLLLTFIFMVGNINHGIAYPQSKKDLIHNIKSSVIGPYLSWKKLEELYKNPGNNTYIAEMNGVKIGKISDTDYKAIKLEVLRDYTVYFKQLFNLLKVVMNAANNLIIAIPVIAFWSILAFIYLDPSILSEIIPEIQKGPSAIQHLIDTFFTLFLTAWAATLMVQTVFFGKVQGFINCFEASVANRLRLHFNVIPEESITLYMIDTQLELVDIPSTIQ